MVEAAFNELLHTYEGMEHVTVNLNISPNKEHANAVALAQSAGQQIDIIQTYRLDFATEISNGTFIAMNDLLEDYPDLKNEFPDWIWEMGSYDGNIYIVPTYQRAANLMYVIAPKEYVDIYGDAEEFRKVFANPESTVEDYAALLEEWIVKVQAGEGNNKYLWPIAEYYSKANDSRAFADGFDTLAGSFILGGEETTVENMWTKDDIVKAYEISADWYEKGYVLPDIVSITDFSSYEKASMMNEEAFIYFVANGIGDEQMMSEKYSKQYGFDVYAFPIGKSAYVANVWASGGNGIYTKSEHPQEAMRLLELLNTEEGEVLYNTLIYGIEGTHYTKVDDTHINTDITGRVPCCDKAVFGFWCSSIGFEEDKEVLESVERLHEEGYPCDVVVIDGPWRGGKAFLRDYTKAGAYPTNDIKWHPDFGDGPGMIQKLLKKNVKTSLHINSRCFLPDTYIPAVEKGLLRAQGEEVVPDFKTQEAIEYYKDLLRPRIKEGLWLWWTDHADRVSGEIEEGIPSRNLFGPLWNKVISETMAEMGYDNHISLSRGSGIGGQKYALPWPGDTKFGLDRFREDIWFCLNAGLAGFSVTSYDLGGFACTPTGAPYKLENDPAFDEENICRRVLQSILFVPVPRIHNNQVSIPKFPWVCPPQTRDLYKQVLQYRYELTPYIYSTAIESSINGTPIIRPLVYHHRKDEMTYGIHDELYLGDNILVAPVVNYGERQRLVYLPEGQWIDNWTGKEYQGCQWIMMDCPLYELKGLPMLVKKGAIIPKQEFSLTLSEEVPKKLFLDIYPAEEGKLVLHEGKDIVNTLLYKACGDYLELELENNAESDRIYEVRAIYLVYGS